MAKKKVKTGKEKAMEVKVAAELRTASLEEKLKKDKRFRTTNDTISNKLQDEGYDAVEAFALTAIAPLTHIFNVDAKLVGKEECEKCGNYVCICPKTKNTE